MHDHMKLSAFKLTDDVVVLIYQLMTRPPREEVYGLASQMRRAHVSLTSNIVEGCSREGQSKYLHFLEIAFGSLRELHYQFGLSKHLGYCGSTETCEYESKIIKIENVLNSLIRSLRMPNPLQPNPNNHKLI